MLWDYRGAALRFANSDYALATDEYSDEVEHRDHFEQVEQHRRAAGDTRDRLSLARSRVIDPQLREAADTASAALVATLGHDEVLNFVRAREVVEPEPAMVAFDERVIYLLDTL